VDVGVDGADGDCCDLVTQSIRCSKSVQSSINRLFRTKKDEMSVYVSLVGGMLNLRRTGGGGLKGSVEVLGECPVCIGHFALF